MPRSVCSCSVASRSAACQTPALGDHQTLAFFVRRDPDDVRIDAAEQAFSPVQDVRGFDELRGQAAQPRPRQCARGLHQLPQARAFDEVRHEVHETRLLAVVAYLDDRRVRDLQCLRLAKETRTRAFPVPFAIPPQQADRHGMPHRAVHAHVNLAAEPSRTEPIADFIHRQQP